VSTGCTQQVIARLPVSKHLLLSKSFISTSDVTGKRSDSQKQHCGEVRTLDAVGGGGGRDWPLASLACRSGCTSLPLVKFPI